MFKREDIVVNKKGQVCKVIDILDNYDVGLGKNTREKHLLCFGTLF